MSIGWCRRPRNGPRLAILAMTLLVVALTASACVRVHASFTVSTGDLVSGEVIAATAGTSGPQLSVPSGLAANVSAKPYQANGYTGSDLTFHDLTFAQLAVLTAANTGGGRYQLSLQRSGDLVSLSGSADLTGVTAAESDIQITVDLPGTVLRADGDPDTDIGSTVVTWHPTAGRISTFSATADASNRHTYPASFWATVLAGACLLIAGFVVLLARIARRRNLRKEKEATGSDQPPMIRR